MFVPRCSCGLSLTQTVADIAQWSIYQYMCVLCLRFY
mgnify:CR=1 FL=1